ncbi:regulatory LuxR family protein [Marinilabilia salmonicolor]|jgi:DNA-binding CsgD family transcriptional regulator/ligand-binding sensor domain-containing protein|uniref:triple tyrosine motif-containing protein n=1 Tax=Marinilabilia salmonicolor TaxID=989 RepID=UPI000D05750A|nr:triple tyrosine motif-containing protein [Marinilabilia salmonicolor]PRZ01055.1 regulatory LuxR family protein [Marinilabilia salmonicolor]
MKNRISLFFLLISISSLLAANPVEYGISEIEYFNRRQYGGATQSWKISQADNGLLYFANNDGIIEYDGSQWRLLERHENLNNNPVRSVFVLEDKIFLGATDEFGYYSNDSVGGFQYSSLTDAYNVDKLGDFWNIFHLNNQIIFQSHNALCLYTPGESVEVVMAESRISEAFLVNDAILLHDDKEGLMELRNGALYKVPGGEIFAGKIIGGIMALSRDEAVIGTMDDGLYLWDVNGIGKWNVPADDILKQSNIFCAGKVGDDLAFGTIQAGVVITDNQGDVKMIAGKDKGLNNNTVLDLFVDRQKNIWAALDNGIARINYNSAVSFIEGYFDLGTGYCMDKKGNRFFLGTNQALYTIKENQFSSPVKSRDDFHRVKGTNGQVWSVYTDEETGEVLVGHNLGIFRVEGESAGLITPGSVNGAWIFRKIPGRKDLLMVGYYGGILLLKREDGGKWEFDQRIDGFPESSRFMEWDDAGNLWVVHGLKGFYRLQFNDSYTRVTEVKTISDFTGIDDYEGFSMSVIDGRIVMASSHGLYTMDPDNKDTFVRDELEKFFYGRNYPVRLQQDRYGNIWFFVNSGVGVLRYQEDGTYRKIDNPMVPLNHKFVNGFESVYVLNEEVAFFGIEDGFGQYSANNDVNYYQPFEVHIRGFKSLTNPDQLFYSNSLSPKQKKIPFFPYQNNAFEVFFSATWFGSGDVEYSTILEGFETGWSPWGTMRNRQFTRLPEGDYTFKVRARNVHGVQSKEAVFHFSIQPPWYRNTIAKIIYVVLAIILAFLIFWSTGRIAEKSKEREKIRQQEKYKEKEAELRREALEKEKEMIRLRNEKLRNDMKHKEKELASSTMHILHKNDFLIKIKDELQNARKTDSQSILDKKINSVIRQIDKDIDNDAHWEIFEKHLEQVHEDFLNRLNSLHDDLSAREMRLAAYLRMNMTSKEIASLMNITSRAVENNRYKLRKKLGLEQGDNLVDYILKI